MWFCAGPLQAAIIWEVIGATICHVQKTLVCKNPTALQLLQSFLSIVYNVPWALDEGCELYMSHLEMGSTQSTVYFEDVTEVVCIII